jgi:DNA-binding response OmpR family regulator
MNVLVVEDEDPIASFIRAGLEEQGFTVEVCANGDDAYVIAKVSSFDAILLDIMLPGRDGLSVLRLLRQGGNEVPIIIITARGDVTERIEGLNLGADDYIAKPFYIDELLARLRSVWRRASGNGLSVLSVGDLSINLMTREATRNEVAIDLTAREFSLLEFLMRSPGRVLTRIQIFEHVWNYHFHPKTNLVDVYIQKLRRKIDDGNEIGLIHTVRGVGYCIKSAT